MITVGADNLVKGCSGKFAHERFNIPTSLFDPLV